jgi:polar amino acid transport system substrate-binding protein
MLHGAEDRAVCRRKPEVIGMDELFVTRRTLMIGAAVASIALALGGLGSAARAATETGFDRLKREKTARVGFANEAPYAFASSDGKLVGLMPDVIGYIMKELGVPNIEGVLTDFGGLIPGLLAGRFDVLGAGLYVTGPRCKQALPSDPQYVVTEAVAVKKGNPKGIHSYADVAAKSDVTIGTLSGSINAQYLATAKVAKNQVVLFPDLPSAIAGLQGGRVDGVTMSSVSLQDVLKKTNDPDLELATPFADPLDEKGQPTRGYGAAWFRKEDEDLVQAYNAKLAEIKASGKLLELIAPYGFTQAQVPDIAVKAAQLCSA